MEENTKEQRGVVFNEDGTIDPAQLAGMPQEFIDRVQSPEFIANAKRQIQERRVADYSLGLYRKKVAKIEAAARVEHAQRRPNGVSGRQRKRLRRLANAGTRQHSAMLQSPREGLHGGSLRNVSEQVACR